MQIRLHTDAYKIANYLPNKSPNLIESEGFELFYQNNFILPWKFNEEEHLKAKNYLLKMGIPKNAKIACLHVRDGNFANKMTKLGMKDFVTNSYRNADIDSYFLASKYLVEQGWYVLRMGVYPKKKLSWANEYIIDYASNFNNQFMDLYLFRYANLIVTTSTGPDMISIFSKIPTVTTNHIYNSVHCQYGPHIILHKHFFILNEDRELSIEEFFINKYKIQNKFKKNKSNDFMLESGIQIIDNSEEEILDAVKECLSMMNNTNQYTDEEEAKQKFLWSFPHNGMRRWRSILARYGRLYVNNTPLTKEISYKKRDSKYVQP
jgi:putative glycosyltransferase (TIGR04372 family)